MVLRKRGDPQLAGECRQTILRGSDPLSAQIEPVAADFLAQCASADPVARFEHQAGDVPFGQFTGGGQPGDAGADDEHVGQLSIAEVIGTGIGHESRSVRR